MRSKKNRSKLPQKTQPLLSVFLHKLPDTGPDGFEGLIGRLLGELVGCRFVLAKSGSQFGRDGQSLHSQSGSVKFECKNYRTTVLNERLLLGELEQVVTKESFVDLWVLVVASEIRAQDVEAVERKANKECIDFLILDCAPDGTGDLDLLCANYPDIVTQFMSRSVAAAPNIRAAKKEMKTIASHPSFSKRVDNLRQKLTKPSLGWPSWVVDSKVKWLQYVLDKDTSKARFKQFIDLISSGNHVIRRESVSNEIDDWFRGWKDSKNPLFIVGEEGVGKTWAIANWITDSINSREKQFPPVVFVSSMDTKGNGSLEELVVATLNEDYGDLNWKKRLNRWQQSQPPEIDGPVAIVVLDGLNERQSVQFWRNVLDTSSNWKNTVAIVCTLRTSYWERYFKSISESKASKCAVKDYDDDELAKALELRNHRLESFPAALHRLLAKPRYLDLAVTHRDELLETGDFTVARLIYMDWKDRYNRKNTCSLADDDFNDLLKSFGKQFLTGQCSWEQEEISKKLALSQDAAMAFQDLSTGGVLEKGPNGWIVNRSSLALGLAMLLCEQLAGTTGNSEARESIETWMGVTPAGDIQSEVLELAALHSIMTKNSPAVRTELFAAWLNTQNPSSNLHETVIQRFTAYLPDNAETYFQLAEIVWSNHFRNSCAEEILIRGFIRWAHYSEEVKAVLAEWLNRWLGMISVGGPLFLRNSNVSDTNLQEVREQLKEIFGDELQAQSQADIDGHTLTLIDDDGLARLSFVALAVLSTFKDAGDYLKPLMTGLMTDSFFGGNLQYPEKSALFSWILRSSAADLSKLVIQFAEQYKESESQITKRSIQEFLTALGSHECRKLANELNAHTNGDAAGKLHVTGEQALESHMPFSQSDLEAYPKSASFNPRIFLSRGGKYFSQSSFQTEGNIAELLMPIFELAPEKEKWEDDIFTPEENFVRHYESGLARYCSERLCDMMRNISQRVSARISTYLGDHSKSFHNLPKFRPYEIDLILTDEERECWKKTSDTVCSDFQTRNFQFQELESSIFRACLPLWAGNEQLRRLLARANYEYDLVSFDYLFSKDEKLHFPEPQSVEDWSRLLFFLKYSNQFVLTKQQLKSALAFDGEGFRGLVFSYIFHSRDSNLINWWHTELNWKWELECNFREEECAAALLIEYGTDISFDELLERLPFTRRGDAIKSRSGDQRTLAEYAKWLDESLRAMLSFEIPEEFPPFEIRYYDCLPSPPAPVSLKHSEESGFIRYVDPMRIWGGKNLSVSPDSRLTESEVNEKWEKEYDAYDLICSNAAKVGHHWIAHIFHTSALKDTIQAFPELATKWIRLAFDPPEERLTKLKRGSSFFQALCEILFDIPERHVEACNLYSECLNYEGLINVIVPKFKYSRLAYTLMNAARSNETSQMWERHLNSSKTDLELLELALLLRSATKGADSRNWFEKKIKQDLQSDIPVLNARAYALLGFLEETADANWLNEDVCEKESWLSEVKMEAQKRFTAECDCKHWFTRFCDETSNDRAWCAFRLFLNLVDRRSYLWMADEIKRRKLSRQKLHFLELNEYTIENACNKNEHELRNTFLNCKVNENLFPWLSFSAPLQFGDRYC